MTGVRFLFRVTLRRHDLAAEIWRMKEPQKLPPVLSPEEGFVTLPCREREVSAPQELSGRCDCGPPRGHRSSAKHAVRLG